MQSVNGFVVTYADPLKDLTKFAMCPCDLVAVLLMKIQDVNVLDCDPLFGCQLNAPPYAAEQSVKFVEEILPFLYM